MPWLVHWSHWSVRMDVHFEVCVVSTRPSLWSLWLLKRENLLDYQKNSLKYISNSKERLTTRTLGSTTSKVPLILAGLCVCGDFKHFPSPEFASQLRWPAHQTRIPHPPYSGSVCMTMPSSSDGLHSVLSQSRGQEMDWMDFWTGLTSVDVILSSCSQKKSAETSHYLGFLDREIFTSTGIRLVSLIGDFCGVEFCDKQHFYFSSQQNGWNNSTRI